MKTISSLRFLFLFFYFVCFWSFPSLRAQVYTDILRLNPVQYDHFRFKEGPLAKRSFLQKTTSNDTLGIPFFDDFSGKNLSWAPSNFAFGAPIRSIRLNGAGSAVAFGGQNVVLQTTNQGSSWGPVSTTGYGDILDVSYPDNSAIWACGTAGYVGFSNDNGQNWTQVAPPQTVGKRFPGIAFISASTGLILDSTGKIFRTENQGVDWALATTDLPGFSARSIAWVNADRVIAVGDSARIGISNDGGKTFSINTMAFGRGRTFRKVRFFDGVFGLSLGDSGMVYKTLTGGLTWEIKYNLGAESLLDVGMNPTNSKLIWAVGERGALLYSQTKGATWSRLSAGTKEDLLSIGLVNEFRGWIGTSEGRLIQVVLDPLQPYSRFWEPNSGVLINNSFPIKPITKGVATFDGINQKGLPYSNVRNKTGPCDTLTSAFLNLRGTGGQNLHVSFFYQHATVLLQTIPDPEDSLTLQFQAPSGAWRSVWNVKGVSETTRATLFKNVAVPVVDSLRFNGFRFRFINYGNQNGSYDVWHLDYVRLDGEHDGTDTLARDFGMGSPLNRLLKSYSALPMEQFRHILSNNPAGYFSDTLSGECINLNPFLTNVSGEFKLNQITPEGKTNLSTIPQSGISGMFPFPAGIFRRNLVANTASLLSSFPTSKYSTFEYGFQLNEDPLTNRFLINDSLYGYFNASTVMASDDGSAELSRFVGENASIGAQKFYLPLTDTLTDIQLFFVRTPENLEQTISFSLLVLDTLNVETNFTNDPPLVRRTFILPPSTDSVNKFFTFSLREAGMENRILKGGRHFYIGWQQGAIDNGNEVRIGADINFKHPYPFYYKAGQSWNAYTGDNFSLLFRPVFGPATITSVQKLTHQPKHPFFPNPSQGRFRNSGQVNNLLVLNLLGQEVKSITSLEPFEDLNLTLPKGLYLFTWHENEGRQVVQRIAID